MNGIERLIADPAMGRFWELLSRVEYEPFRFKVSKEGPNYFMRVVDPSAEDNTNPAQPFDSKGRKWRLSPHMVDGEVVATAFKAVLTYIEHETRERFTFDGVSVYDSHVDIHKLVALRKEPDAVVGRTPHEMRFRMPPRDADIEAIRRRHD